MAQNSRRVSPLYASPGDWRASPHHKIEINHGLAEVDYAAPPECWNVWARIELPSGARLNRPLATAHVVTDIYRERDPHLEAQANAQLFAAAKELYQSCEEFLPILASQVHAMNPNGSADASSAWQLAKARVERMRAAVLKARGQGKINDQD